MTSGALQTSYSTDDNLKKNWISQLFQTDLRTRSSQPKKAQTKKEESEPREEEQSKFYEIKSGDNLSKIARQFYGDANKYPLIFEANREVIKDPDKIYPGQVIRIPRLQ